MSAGDIHAIRDWWNASHYNKNEIFSFFNQINQGYVAYDFTILNGEANGACILEGQTSEQRYEIKLDSNGNCKHNLFFFSSGEDVDVTSGEDTITETLNDSVITIDFNPYSETVLWDYVTDNGGTIPFDNYNEFTMRDSIDNYDYVSVEVVSAYSDLTSAWRSTEIYFTWLVDALNNNPVPNNLLFWTYYQRGSHLVLLQNKFQITNATQSSINGIVKIVGRKVTHTTTVLWDYVTDNNSQFLYGLFDITLHDSIDNYDELIFEVESLKDDIGSAQWSVKCLIRGFVNAIKNSYHANYFHFTTYANRSTVFYANGNNLKKTFDNAANTNNLIRVYGIKYN